MIAVMTSPITGADGNVEFLGHFTTGGAVSATPGERGVMIDAALDEAFVLTGREAERGGKELVEEHPVDGADAVVAD